MPRIRFRTRTVMHFDSVDKMNEYIFDRGFEVRGKSLYYEVEDGQIECIGEMED
jgi:hypothetical protein